MGSTGPEGLSGATGVMGWTGDMGDTGPRGSPGPVGIVGPPGILIYVNETEWEELNNLTDATTTPAGLLLYFIYCLFYR